MLLPTNNDAGAPRADTIRAMDDPIGGLFGVPLSDWRVVLGLIGTAFTLAVTIVLGLRKFRRLRDKPDLQLRPWINKNQEDCPIIQVEIANHSPFDVTISSVGLYQKRRKRWRMDVISNVALTWLMKGIETREYRLRSHDATSIQLPWQSFGNDRIVDKQYIWVSTPLHQVTEIECAILLREFTPMVDAKNAQAREEHLRRIAFPTPIRH